MGVSNSKDGLATAETAVAWLGHFDKHTKPRVAEAYRMLILESHRYSTMTESQKDHVWEQIRKVTEIFESCTMSTDALQAEMNAIAEDLRKCIRQRSEGKCRPKSVAAVSRTLPKRKILKERAKRHCRGCGH